MGTVISLSARQVKEADRVGGIELMIFYPTSLGEPGELKKDEDREATVVERRHAEQMVIDSCRKNGLVPVHVRVACVHRPIWPRDMQAPADRYAPHLAVTIIGHRWVHATRAPDPRVMFAEVKA